MDGLKVVDDKYLKKWSILITNLRNSLSTKKLSRENTPTMTISPSPSIGLIQVEEATKDFDGQALLSTQYGWEEIEEDRSITDENVIEGSRRRRAFNTSQNQSLNQFQ